MLLALPMGALNARSRARVVQLRLPVGWPLFQVIQGFFQETCSWAKSQMQHDLEFFMVLDLLNGCARHRACVQQFKLRELQADHESIPES